MQFLDFKTWGIEEEALCYLQITAPSVWRPSFCDFSSILFFKEVSI